MESASTRADWAAEFFTQLYLEADDQLRFGGDAEAQVDFVVNTLGLSPGQRVLDLGCGIGRHSIEFARRGYRVTGVDVNLDYLARAENHAPEGLDLSFVHADMRTLPRTLESGCCDVVVSMHTSFGLFSWEEELRVLAGIAHVLDERGRLLIDVTNRDWFLSHWGPSDFAEEGQAFVVRDHEWVGETVFLHEESFDPLTSMLRWNVVRVNGDSSPSISTDYRLYSMHEVVGLLSEAGFGVTATHGDYHGCGFEVHSPHIICVAAPGPDRRSEPSMAGGT